MNVYVLSEYWSAEDDEGNDVLGVYQNVQEAINDMRAYAAPTKADVYRTDFWDEDTSWENERGIHLCHDPCSGFDPATIYCWKITEKEIQ